MPAGDGLEGLGDQVRRGRTEAGELREEMVGIANDLGDLLRSEVELAKAEIREQAAQGAKIALWAGVAVVAALLTVAFVFVTEFIALDAVMRAWLAALITTATLAGITAVAGGVAYAHFRELSVVPTKTITSVREDVRWARGQLSSSSRTSESATP